MLPRQITTIPANEVTRDKALTKGATANIFSAQYQGETVVVKSSILTKDDKEWENTKRQFDFEIGILSQIKHPGVVKFHGMITDSTHNGIEMVLENMNQGDLRDYLTAYSYPDAHNHPERKKLLKDILFAICYIHLQGVVHRDIKPSNILLNRHQNKITAKVGDFGLARYLDKHKGHYQSNACAGTAQYLSPEIASVAVHNKSKKDQLDYYYTPESDMYGFGLVWLALCLDSFALPYPDHDSDTIRFYISSGQKPSIPKHVSAHTRKCLNWCLQFQPQDRVSADQLIEEMKKDPTPSNQTTAVDHVQTTFETLTL